MGKPSMNKRRPNPNPFRRQQVRRWAGKACEQAGPTAAASSCSAHPRQQPKNRSDSGTAAGPTAVTRISDTSPHRCKTRTPTQCLHSASKSRARCKPPALIPGAHVGSFSATFSANAEALIDNDAPPALHSGTAAPAQRCPRATLRSQAPPATAPLMAGPGGTAATSTPWDPAHLPADPLSSAPSALGWAQRPLPFRPLHKGSGS